MGLNRDFRPVSTNGGRRIRFLNNSGAAISESTGFKLSATGIVTALDDDNIIGLYGIACADVAAGKVGECYVDGAFEVSVEGTVDFVQGGKVYSASANTVDAGTAADVPIGSIIGEDPTSGATSVTIEIISTVKSLAVHA